MLGYIVQDGEQEQELVGKLILAGFGEGEARGTWVRGHEVIWFIHAWQLKVKETLMLDFKPIVYCKLDEHAQKVVDYINLRHLGGITVETTDKDPIMTQLWA